MKTGVIGAGIGGLATACLLAADGHEVSVWEKNATVGGKMNQRQVGGYRFDTGPSLLTMPEIIHSIFEACGKNAADYLEIVPVNPVCRYYWKDGTRFDCSTNLPETLSQIQKFAPKDAEAYVKFLGYSADIYQKTAETFLFNPLHKLRDLRKVKKSDFFKIDAFSTVSSKVDKYFESPYLRQFFKRFTTYNGSSPYIAPATLNVIPYVELCLGGFYVKGGLYQIALAFEKLAKEMGVRFNMNTTITSIDTKEGAAKTIRTATGQTIGVDALFSNADATHTYTKLLNDDVIKPRSKQQFKKIEPSCSGFVLLLGTSKKFDQLGHHTIFFSDDYEKEFRELFIKKRIAPEPTIYIANTSKAESGHAPDGGSNLFVLVNTPYLSKEVIWDENQIQTYGDSIIDQLESCGLTGLRDSIEVREHITPQDFYDLYLSNKGSIYGTSSNLPLSAFMRPRNKSPYVNNLYLTGGSTHPGGGIPLAILSAKHAISLFKRDIEV
jgi:phytoene desaturase